jgi:hypothetical protein
MTAGRIVNQAPRPGINLDQINEYRYHNLAFDKDALDAMTWSLLCTGN